MIRCLRCEARPWFDPRVILMVSAVLAACAPIKQEQLTTALQKATDGYQDALRWGYFESAYGYLHPDQRANRPLPDTFKGLHLTGYEVLQPPMIQPDRETAIQIAAIDYLYEDRQVVRHLTDRQTWRYDPKRKAWWLISGLPDFKP